MTFGINVFDFGAKGDGKTDDTKAIQAAIDFADERGGGCVLFPYTKHGYCIASPGIEEYKGQKVRSQIVIPPGGSNIMLMGEMPCRLLNAYIVRDRSESKFLPTKFGTMRLDNTVLFSTWEAPEVHNPEERPWSVISAPEGTSCNGKFSKAMASIHNLEVRVHLNTDKMYPTQSAVNFQNVARINIQDSQFCLNEQVGDTDLEKWLMPNPCHTVGFMASGDQSDNNVLRNVAVQGFKYGFVFGEQIVAEYLYAHNCEEAVVFHDASHMSVINHIQAQHNRRIITTTRENLFGHQKGPCKVRIGSVNFECGTGYKPEISQLQYGVYDPENRLIGSLVWHKPWGEQEFPVFGAENFKISKFD